MKLAIDPGHGMSNRSFGKYDPGAVAGGVAEADIALQFALTIKWVAKTEFGIDVFLTRDDDRDHAPVSSRDDAAKKAGCTHFISLHMNAGGMLAKGIETFYRDVEDLRFAQKIHPAVVAALGLSDRLIKHESQTAVGKLAVMAFKGPAILIELGFITNAKDRARCLQRDARIAVARAILTSVKEMK